mgnify:CR=1 FL=1
MTRMTRWISGILVVAMMAAATLWVRDAGEPPAPSPAREAAAERLHAHLAVNPPDAVGSVQGVTAAADGLHVEVRLELVQVASLKGGPPNYRKDRMSAACPTPETMRELDLVGPVTVDARSPHRERVVRVACDGPFGPL